MNTTTSAAVREDASLRGGRAPAVGWSGAAVSGSGYTIPVEFLWLLDLCSLWMVWLIAWRLTPEIQWLTAAEQLGRLPGLSALSPPPAAYAAGLRPFGEVLWIPLAMIPVTLLFMHVLGGYRPLLSQSRTRVALTSIVAPLFALSVFTLLLITSRNQSTSRALLFSFTLMSAASLFAYRSIIRLYKYRRSLAGLYARNIVVIAPRSARQWLSRHFAASVSPAFHRLHGYLELSDEVAHDPDPADPDLLPRLGAVEDLGDLLVNRPIHEVIVVQSSDAEAWLNAVIEQCEYFRLTVRLMPQALLAWRPRDLPVLYGGPLHLPEIVLRPRHLDDGALFVKRIFDIVVSGVLLVLLSPLFLLIAIGIKLTTPRLPILYPWRVIGYKGRAFTGYKFTTMVADADERKSELMHLNEMSGPVFKINNDPRVTPLGRLLRKFSLNELPQLWSVLKGDMSLVGPRPAYPNELARYELWHKRKLCVQPGITCLWQVSGRNKISNFDDWVRMDCEYIDNWSLWLDCRILIKTAWSVVAGTGS